MRRLLDSCGSSSTSSGSSGGSRGMVGGGVGGGGRGGSIQMLRSVQRAVRASAASQEFSNAGSSSKNSTSAGRRPRRASDNGFTLYSSSTSSPFYPPISASSSAWPSSPTFSDESSDWVCIGGSEDDRALCIYDDSVFEDVPSHDEVHHAVLALQEVTEPGSLIYSARDRSINKLDTDVDDLEVALSIGHKLDWIEPPCQLWSSDMLQARGYGRVHDAFSLLRNEPSVQRMVVSLSSDKAVWNAVLNNEVVQELRESFKPADMSPSEESDDGGDHDASDVAKSFLKWIIVSTKAKVMEFIDKISKLVNELFLAEEGAKNGDKRSDAFEEKLRASFFLSVVVMLIVVVSRAKA